MRHDVLGLGRLDIHEVGSLPRTVHTCGRDFGRSEQSPESAEFYRSWKQQGPVLVDPPPFAPCPAEFCDGEACHTVVYVRVGEDELWAYELRGGP